MFMSHIKIGATKPIFLTSGSPRGGGGVHACVRVRVAKIRYEKMMSLALPGRRISPVWSEISKTINILCKHGTANVIIR